MSHRKTQLKKVRRGRQKSSTVWNFQIKISQKGLVRKFWKFLQWIFIQLSTTFVFFICLALFLFSMYTSRQMCRSYFIDLRTYLTSWRRSPGTRKFRSKEWIQRHIDLLIDLPYPNRSIPWIWLPGVLLVLGQGHPL